MAIKEENILVAGTGKVLDTTTVKQTDSTVAHREAVVITDPEKLKSRANVFPIPPIKSSEQTYAGAVSDRRLEFIQEVMESILGELKVMNQHLAVMTDEEFSDDSS